MNPPNPVVGGQALVERYETLRNSVGQCVADRQDARGAALLMRQGLAAWMRWVGEPGGSQLIERGTAACAGAGGPPPASAIEPMLVNIMASMALAHAREVCG